MRRSVIIKRMLLSSSLVVMVLFGLASCATSTPSGLATIVSDMSKAKVDWSGTMRNVTFDRTARPIEQGQLATRGIRIESHGSRWDSSWSVRGGDSFSPPFTVYWWGDERPAIDEPYVDDYEKAWQAGARQVKIHLDGRDETLYGLLVFNQAVESTCGPARDSYLMHVKRENIETALDGDIAVAYENLLLVPEQTTCKRVAASIRGYEANGLTDAQIYSENGPLRRRPTWMLWLYDEPLVE